VLAAGRPDGLSEAVLGVAVLGVAVLGVAVLGAAGALVEGTAEAGLVGTAGAWVWPADRLGVVRMPGVAGLDVAGPDVAGPDVAGPDVGEAPGVSGPLGVGRAEIGE
jgi:hypothetical protein